MCTCTFRTITFGYGSISGFIKQDKLKIIFVKAGAIKQVGIESKWNTMSYTLLILQHSNIHVCN